ncbi:MAG: hypothetical protein JWN85_1140 [Gammaproteobacteria bacterium]|nr:hypothetical protein [Gammaproteobacteria bacterium]
MDGQCISTKRIADCVSRVGRALRDNYVVMDDVHCGKVMYDDGVTTNYWVHVLEIAFIQLPYVFGVGTGLAAEFRQLPIGEAVERMESIFQAAVTTVVISACTSSAAKGAGSAH